MIRRFPLISFVISVLVMISAISARSEDCPSAIRHDAWFADGVPVMPDGGLAGAAVAVLPVLTPRDTPETVRRAVLLSLVDELRLLHPDWRIVDPAVVTLALSGQQQREQYSTLLRAVRRGVTNHPPGLHRIAAAVEARYILHVEATYGEEGDHDPAPTASIHMRASLWDSETGNTVWEGGGHSTDLLIDDLLVRRAGQGLARVIGGEASFARVLADPKPQPVQMKLPTDVGAGGQVGLPFAMIFAAAGAFFLVDFTKRLR